MRAKRVRLSNAQARTVEIADIPEERRVWLIAGVEGPSMEAAARDVAIDVEQLKDNWKDVMAKVGQMLDSTPSFGGGLGLSAVEISLLLEASGKIGFIFAEGSGKVSATFKVVFARPK